jgi:hypothetical protein
MPIRPDLRHFYGHEWRTVTRPRILARAKNKCEQCAKPNGRKVWVWKNQENHQYWTLSKARQLWRYCRFGSEPGNFWLSSAGLKSARRIRVVLTVAHLNHTSGDDRDENLKALCQWCHLDYDKQHHRDTRAARKDRSRPILVLASAGNPAGNPSHQVSAR